MLRIWQQAVYIYYITVMDGTDIYALRTLCFWAGFLFFLLLEWSRPYRPPTVPKASRLGTNISLALINSIILYLVFTSVILNTSAQVAARQAGMLNMVSLPSWAKMLLTLAFMDFIFYIWHLLNHVMPLLWRFHSVHHSDPNMDVSTATRFHIGELSFSAVIKIGLVFFLGADIMAVALFEGLLVLAAQFNHSSLRVPLRFERILRILFVPPSMHRIHHSVVIRERDSNYGTIFSVWDRIFGTFLINIDQDRIVIGMASYRNLDSLKLQHLLLMPFTKKAG